MKTLFSVILFCLTFSYVAGQTTPKEKLNNAIYLEEVNGELEKAIQLYDEIVKTHPDERAIVAEALYRSGLANEKLGNQKAKEYYEKVVSGYSDQPEMVKLAQVRLNRIKHDSDKIATDSWMELTRKKGDEKYVVSFYDKDANIGQGTMLEGSRLSPDGTRLVGVDFSIGQNIAIYNLKTKQIKLFTKYEWIDKNMPITYFPVWSPDGNELAFAYVDKNGFNIKVSTFDGKTRTLIEKDSIMQQVIPQQWSSDGSSILTFQQDDDGFFTIGLVTTEDGKFYELHKTQWKGSKQLGLVPKGGASLSPDGKSIVFADGPTDNQDLYIMDTNSGTPTLLSKNPTSEYNPLWSPDGKYVVFIRETNGDAILYAMKIENKKPIGQPYPLMDGMQNISLTDWTEYGITYDLLLNIHDIYTLILDPETYLPKKNPEPLQYTPTGSNIQPVCSFSGKFLEFISYGNTPKVIILATDGENPRYYPIEAPGFNENSLYDLNWLPDDSGISFSVRDPNLKSVIYHLNLETGGWQHWYPPVNHWIRTAWGPDNKTVVYGRVGSEGAGIYKFNTELKQAVKICDVDLDEEYYVFRQFQFTGDMKKLACDVVCPSGRKLLLLDMESEECKVVVEKYNFETFSPDGKKILASRDDKMNIFSLKGELLNQFDAKQYFPEGTNFRSFDWSNDGRKLLINTQNLVNQTLLMRNVLK